MRNLLHLKWEFYQNRELNISFFFFRSYSNKNVFNKLLIIIHITFQLVTRLALHRLTHSISHSILQYFSLIFTSYLILHLSLNCVSFNEIWQKLTALFEVSIRHCPHFFITHLTEYLVDYQNWYVFFLAFEKIRTLFTFFFI